MKHIYSRRDFINRAKILFATVGATTVFPVIAATARAKEASVGMSEISGKALGQSLSGIGFNLLVTDVMASVKFAEEILLADAVRADKFFAILKHRNFMWMYHADWTYRNNALAKLVAGAVGRGRGVELRLYNQDPDKAEKRAKEHGYQVLIESSNKPHGLRECSILDPDGYCWVISRHLNEGEK